MSSFNMMWLRQRQQQQAEIDRLRGQRDSLQSQQSELQRVADQNRRAATQLRAFVPQNGVETSRFIRPTFAYGAPAPMQWGSAQAPQFNLQNLLGMLQSVGPMVQQNPARTAPQAAVIPQFSLANLMQLFGGGFA